MTKLQKLLFTLIIAGSTQGWASEEIDFKSMDSKTAKTVFMEILTEGDVERSRDAIKALFSQRPEWGGVFTGIAKHHGNVKGNAVLNALLDARGVEEVKQEEVMAPVAVMHGGASVSDIYSNEAKEEFVREPIPAFHDILSPSFSDHTGVIEAGQGDERDNVFLFTMQCGGALNALELLADPLTRPELPVLKCALESAPEYIKAVMADEAFKYNIPQDYSNAIYGIDDSVVVDPVLPSNMSAFAPETVFDSPQVVDEFQEQIDAGFSLAIHTDPEMVGGYLSGIFGSVPSHVIVKMALATLKEESPSSKLIGLLEGHLSK